MDNFLNEFDLVLIAVMPKPKDLEIARLLGWYRIPLKSAPKVIAVDYLAFYQPSSFGDKHRWKIEYCAPVLGHELTTRRELFRDEPDHPRSDEEYFKVQIGALRKLPSEIIADHWRRVTFLYTTGGLINRGETLRDLVVDGDERQVLWAALRERAKNFTPDSEHNPQIPDLDFFTFFQEWDKIKESDK